ncbi:MAG: gamma-glutamylcyclotransferase [Pontiellaceae bacterium]|nr:gamma-glutamylcyclotransferase [Pontiellaceae bacterium]MBN2785871.1 gamma-glutamylcyclotransferase [Pontiellaceae bacterium]
MNTDQPLRIFVYGTLKRGYWNHDRFCSQAVSIEPATTWGRLFHLPAGFPALEMPDCRILALGTSDPLADTLTQNTIALPKNSMDRPDGDWDLIHGELMTFNDPIVDLPPVDRLEGFNPHGRSMYERVLTAVESHGCLQTCWVYLGLENVLRGGVRLSDGYWNGSRFRQPR